MIYLRLLICSHGNKSRFDTKSSYSIDRILQILPLGHHSLLNQVLASDYTEVIFTNF